MSYSRASDPIIRNLFRRVSRVKMDSSRNSGGMMNKKATGRRDFLKHASLMGSIAMIGGFSQNALALDAAPGEVIEDAVVSRQSEESPKYHIKFGVCGMSHDHVFCMVGAVQRGGGELASLLRQEPDKL